MVRNFSPFPTPRQIDSTEISLYTLIRRIFCKCARDPDNHSNMKIKPLLSLLNKAIILLLNVIAKDLSTTLQKILYL